MEDPRWGELDRHLFNEGRHHRLWRHLGAHPHPQGTWFAVWAPDASAVSVIGDFNDYSVGANPLVPIATTGIWSGLVTGARPGHSYKYAVTDRHGHVVQKADPMATATEAPPKTASVIDVSTHVWSDDRWQQGDRKSVV